MITASSFIAALASIFTGNDFACPKTVRQAVRSVSSRTEPRVHILRKSVGKIQPMRPEDEPASSTDRLAVSDIFKRLVQPLAVAAEADFRLRQPAFGAAHIHLHLQRRIGSFHPLARRIGRGTVRSSGEYPSPVSRYVKARSAPSTRRSRPTCMGS